MDNWVNIQKDEKHIKREKAKARELRDSGWWKQELTKGICHYCHKKFKKSELTMDHLVPISRGGKSTKGNCVICCKECNNKKGCLTPVDMILNNLKKNWDAD